MLDISHKFPQWIWGKINLIILLGCASKLPSVFFQFISPYHLWNHLTGIFHGWLLPPTEIPCSGFASVPQLGFIQARNGRSDPREHHQTLFLGIKMALSQKSTATFEKPWLLPYFIKHPQNGNIIKRCFWGFKIKNQQQHLKKSNHDYCPIFGQTAPNPWTKRPRLPLRGWIPMPHRSSFGMASPLACLGCA